MADTSTRADRAELSKRVERAGKLLQKGKAAEALEEYLLVLRDDPENDKVRELSADLCLAQSRGHDAARLLGELFERQVNAGDATRASLTYKKLARHGSPTWDQKFRFGQLLEGSNKKLAVGTYESALSDLAKLTDKKSDACLGTDPGKFSADWGAVVRTGREQASGGSVQTRGAIDGRRGWRSGSMV
jgi:tetratricopeptide (TPR) repeat protein